MFRDHGDCEATLLTKHKSLVQTYPLKSELNLSYTQLSACINRATASDQDASVALA